MANSLSLKDNHRRSLLRNLTTSLIIYEQVKTTQAKAKEIVPISVKMINLAKKNDLSARRKLLGYFFDKKAVEKIFEVLIKRYQNISSGFVKVYKLGPRLGDGSEMVLVKLVPILTDQTDRDEIAIIKDQNVKQKQSTKESLAEKKPTRRTAKTKTNSKIQPGSENNPQN